MIEEFKKRLGKWALPAWFLCGLAAFGVFVATAKFFMPEMVEVPTDWVMWLLDSLLFLLCVLGGPLAMMAALLLFVLVALFTLLIG
jgi:hypothetical protein